MAIKHMTKDFYKNTNNGIEEVVDTSSYEAKRPLPIRKKLEVLGIMKKKLGGEIVKESVGLRPKAYLYVKDND